MFCIFAYVFTFIFQFRIHESRSVGYRYFAYNAQKDRVQQLRHETRKHISSPLFLVSSAMKCGGAELERRTENERERFQKSKLQKDGNFA